MIVEIKGRNHKIVRLIKGYRVTRINVHNIVCSKQVYKFIKKYKRYALTTYAKLKVFNNSGETVELNDLVTLGYLGRQITPTKSHTIVKVEKIKNNE